MHKKLRITIEGKSYDVLVEDLSATEDTYSAISSVMTAPVAAAAPALAAAPVPSAGKGDEVSPLSGVVEAVEVKVGQTIAAGDKIAVIESMKMKTPVHAINAGVVKSVAVKPGDSIMAGGIILSVG